MWLGYLILILILAGVIFVILNILVELFSLIQDDCSDLQELISFIKDKFKN